jgi:hypothetical protein
MSAFLAEMRSPAGPQRPAGPRNRKGSLGNEPLPIAHCTNGGSVGAVCLSASKSRRSSANVKFDNVGREKSHKAATERVRRTQRSSDPSPPGGSQSRRSSALRPRPTTSGLGNLRPQRPARTKSPAPFNKVGTAWAQPQYREDKVDFLEPPSDLSPYFEPWPVPDPGQPPTADEIDWRWRRGVGNSKRRRFSIVGELRQTLRHRRNDGLT